MIAANLSRKVRANSNYASNEYFLPVMGLVIKIGAKVVRHSGYMIFQMAEVAVPRELFAAILDRIQRFGVPPPLLQRG